MLKTVQSCSNIQIFNHLLYMKKLAFIFLLIPVFIFSQKNFDYKRDFATILKESQNKNSDLNFDRLVVRYHNTDTTLTDKQMLALLIGFTENKYYKPYKDLDFGRNLYKLNDEQNFDQVIKEGTSFIETHPFDLKTLFELSYAYHKKGNEILAKEFLKKTRMIFNAMVFSGDALSIENPIFALNPSDGQDFIRKGLEQKIGKMGSGKDKDGYFIEMLEMKGENESGVTLYFIIPHATKKMFEQ